MLNAVQGFASLVTHTLGVMERAESRVDGAPEVVLPCTEAIRHVMRRTVYVCEEAVSTRGSGERRDRTQESGRDAGRYSCSKGYPKRLSESVCRVSRKMYSIHSCREKHEAI